MCLQIRHLGCIGGKTVADTTRHVMRQVFDVKLARQLKFAGRGTKTGISGMTITSAVVREYLYSDAI